MKRVLYTLLFFGLLFIAAFFTDRYFGKRYAFNQALNSNWVWQLNAINVDYIAMGSSRVKSGVDVIALDSLLNTNGLNIGEHGIGIAEQYLLFTRFAQFNKTKYLVLQVDHSSLNSDNFVYPFHEYNYFPYMGDTLVDNVMRQQVGTAKFLFYKYVPMFKYAEFNSEYVSELFVQPTKNARDGKGFIPITIEKKAGANSSLKKEDNSKKKASDKQAFGNFLYNKADSVYMHKILTIAKANNIKVILYSAPENIDNSPDYVQKEVPSMITYYKAISTKYNVPYFHFFGSSFSNNRDNISGDGLHLTKESIKVFNPIMADSLKKYMQ
jgi:hypothetical protein